MAKGFKDSSGKFHPTGNNGTSSRAKSVETSVSRHSIVRPVTKLPQNIMIQLSRDESDLLSVLLNNYLIADVRPDSQELTEGIMNNIEAEEDMTTSLLQLTIEESDLLSVLLNSSSLFLAEGIMNKIEAEQIE